MKPSVAPRAGLSCVIVGRKPNVKIHSKTGRRLRLGSSRGTRRSHLIDGRGKTRGMIERPPQRKHEWPVDGSSELAGRRVAHDGLHHPHNPPAAAPHPAPPPPP